MRSRERVRILPVRLSIRLELFRLKLAIGFR